MRHEKQVGMQRKRRAMRVRNRLKRDTTRPRLSVFRSHKNFYAQIIDDSAGRTLVSASTLDKRTARRIEIRRQQNCRRGGRQGHRPARHGGRHQGSRVRPPRIQVSRPRCRPGRRRPRSRIGVLEVILFSPDEHTRVIKDFFRHCSLLIYSGLKN